MVQVQGLSRIFLGGGRGGCAGGMPLKKNLDFRSSEIGFDAI